MASPESIYLGAPLLRATSGLPEHESLTFRINRIAERYLAIVGHHRVALDEAETLALKEILAGCDVEPLTIRYLADEIDESSYGSTDMGHRLAEKLRAASFAELVGTVERLGY